MPRLTNEELGRRARELMEGKSRGRFNEFPTEAIDEYRQSIDADLASVRKGIAEGEEQLARAMDRLREKRELLAELEYLKGSTDVVPGTEPRALVGGELCQKHIGLRVSSFTYRNARKSTGPSAGKETYTITGITHQQDGIIVIRRGLYLRSTTLLTVIEDCVSKS